MEQRLVRLQSDRMLGGVCSGLGYYLGIDSTLVRIFFAASVLLGFGTTIPIYILLWIVMPQEPGAQFTPRAPLPEPAARAQDPTGEWKYDPYTGEPMQSGTPAS
jgi:phage shock protein C